MMKHLKICCFLGLALLLLTLPVRSAELPPEVERALPREAGQLLKDVATPVGEDPALTS